MQARILIVDDEQALVGFLRRTLLLELPDSRVDVAYSGEAALSCLAVDAYDLIIADLRMPGFDGLELIKGVRYLNPLVPIVMMTGFGSEAIRQEAAKLGVDYYVDKPFEVGELLAVARELLSEYAENDDE
jgi:two-component system response regulator PilR (NtrC family)